MKCFNNTKWASGKCSQYGHQGVKGTDLTLKLDFDKGEISIIANGTDMGVGFLGIDLKSGRYRILICLYNRY